MAEGGGSTSRRSGADGKPSGAAACDGAVLSASAATALTAPDAERRARLLRDAVREGVDRDARRREARQRAVRAHDVPFVGEEIALPRAVRAPLVGGEHAVVGDGAVPGEARGVGGVGRCEEVGDVAGHHGEVRADVAEGDHAAGRNRRDGREHVPADAREERAGPGHGVLLPARGGAGGWLGLPPAHDRREGEPEKLGDAGFR